MADLQVVDILLVEDSDADAEMTIRALTKNNLGNKLTWVKDGVEALDFIYCRGAYQQRGNGHPKLILLDIKMPKMSGIEVLQQLKSDTQTKMIPVVILTSSAESTDVTESYNLGVNSYLVKPVGFDAFMTVVAQTGLYWTVTNKAP